MAAELGIAAAAAGIVGVSASSLIEKVHKLSKRVKDVGDNFKESSEHFSQRLLLAHKILQDYRKFEKERFINFQVIGEDRRPEYTSVGKAVEILNKCINEANAYLDELDKKSKGKMLFKGKQIDEKFQNLSDELHIVLDLLALAVQVNEVTERSKNQEKLTDIAEGIKHIRENQDQQQATASSDTNEFDLGCCQQEIIDFYMVAMRQVNLLPWFDEDARNMDDIYVSLKLENDGKFLDSNENLVNIRMPNGTLAKRVLVRGTVGSGKSTLMAKLAYMWAQRNPNSCLYKYELVFILCFREIQKGCSIIDALFQQILADNTRVSKAALYKYISSNANILFLLDGFDEYFAKNVDTIHGEIDSMLNFRTFREASVIVSSRRHNHFGKCQSLYTRVTLIGFSQQNVKLYLSKFFYNNNELVKGLSTRLSRSENLKSLSLIPIMLMVMCLLWDDSQSLPNKQSELYAEFAKFLWKKYCHKYNKSSDDDDSLRNFLIDLGTVAFDGLMSEKHMDQEKLMFSEVDFLEYLELGFQVGLLSKERLRSKLSVSSAVTFLHKSFQEYSASYYWASLPDDQFDCALQRIDMIDKVEDKIEILKYLCGTDRVLRIIQHVIQVYLANINNDEPVHTNVRELYICGERVKDQTITAVLNLLHESDYPSSNDQLTESLRSLLSAGKELFIDINFPWPSFVKSPLASTLNQVQSIIFMQPSNQIVDPTEIDVISDTLTFTSNVAAVRICLQFSILYPERPTDRMGKLGKCIGRLTNLSTLDLQFDARTDHIGWLNITSFIDLLSTHCRFQLRCMKLYKNHNPSLSCDCDILCRLLASQHQLRTLTLYCIQLYNGTMEYVLDAIKAPLCDLKLHDIHTGNAIGHITHIIPHLHCLQLSNTDLEEKNILTLGEMLPNAKHLSTLDLSQNHVGKAISTLSWVIHDQLEELNIASAHLDEDDILTLSGFLNEAKCLSNLDLSGNKVGREAGRLCEKLKSCSNLKELNVNDTGLTAEDVRTLKQSLSNVRIRSNNITDMVPLTLPPMVLPEPGASGSYSWQSHLNYYIDNNGNAYEVKRTVGIRQIEEQTVNQFLQQNSSLAILSKPNT